MSSAFPDRSPTRTLLLASCAGEAHPSSSAVPRNAFFEEKRLENEAELMKDVVGWEVGASVYKSGRYMRPMTVFGLNDDK